MPARLGKKLDDEEFEAILAGLDCGERAVTSEES